MTPPAPASRTSRAARLPLAAVTALALALGFFVAHPLTAAAATGPTVVDDFASVSVAATETGVPGAANDHAGSAPIDPALTVFPTSQLSSLPTGSDISDDGTVLLYGGFGIFRINEGGRITFDPEGVTGRRTVHYRITDTGGLSAEGSVTVTVTAGAGNDELDTTQGTPVSQDILADDRPGRNADGSLGTIDRSSLRFRATQSAPVTVSANGLVVTFPKVGVFTIDATTRILTFAPEFAYVSPNTGYALYYTAQDTTRTANGTIEHHPISAQVRWQVAALDRLKLTETVSPALYVHVGDTLTWKSVLTNVGSTPLNAITLTHSLAARLTGETCTPVALGGTLPAGTSTTCTATSRVKQQDLDSNEARIDDTVIATGTTTQAGHTVTARVQNGTSTVARISQGLAVTARTSPATVSTVGQRIDYTFVVRNKGNRTLKDLIVRSSSPGISALVCAPSALGGSLGDSTTTTCTATRIVTAADLKTKALTAIVKATAVPVTGYPYHAHAANAVATVSVPVGVSTPPVTPVPSTGSGPVASADTASTTVGHPVIVNVLANDRAGAATRPLVGSSVRLRTSAALPAGSVLYGDTKVLVVAGRGWFLVSGTGQITFVPLGTATGPVPTVGYQVADVNGKTARATLTVTVR